MRMLQIKVGTRTEQLREWLLRRLQMKLPTWWTDLVAEIRVLSRRRMVALFPNARVDVEFFFGLPKSYIAYSAPSSVSKAG
jgi:hypothetical protein